MMSGVAAEEHIAYAVGLKPKLRAPEASRPVERMPKSTRRTPSQVAGAGDVGAGRADNQHYQAADGQTDHDGDYGGEHGARAVLAVEVGKTLSHAVASFPWRLAPAI